MGEASLTYDAVLDLCDDGHRRIVLTTLMDAQRSLTVADLTEAIATHTDHVSIGEKSVESHSKLRATLHHAHLPKIEAWGLIEYDQEARRVRATEQLEQVRASLAPILAGDSSFEAPMGLQ